MANLLSSELTPGQAAASRSSPAPVVIEVRGVSKRFRVPVTRIDSFKERVTHPLARREFRDLRALNDVSFDVRQGEFFGIVGRNGSGKSTLLKILSSIYRADAGTVRVAGRLAPFIELGVGFNPELTSRENVVLNGVLMGLSAREARRRLDAVLEFAELEDFANLKLKNYSSGMMVRLAFAVMVEADADIMLIDEVLAVGDAAFAQKCIGVFSEKRRAGKTLVLVTHDMTTVQSFCDRALLIENGDVQHVGDPEETAMRYFRLNFAETKRSGLAIDPAAESLFGMNAGVVDAWLENGAGQRVENVEQDEPLRLSMILEATQDLRDPAFGVHIRNADDVLVFGFTATLGEDGEGGPGVTQGERLRIGGEIANPLVPGHYSIDCWVARNPAERDGTLQRLRLFDFVVYGTRATPGVVSVDADVGVTVDRGPRT